MALPDLGSLLGQRHTPLGGRHCFREEGWHVWCPSMVRDEEGIYHLLYSRWPVATGFDGWVTHSEIARASTPDLSRAFVPQGPVMQERPGPWWDAHSVHNPVIQRFEGRYYLYYTGNFGVRTTPGGPREFWDHRNHQRIGVAVAASPLGPWERMDAPVIEVTPGAWDALMTANPTITRTPEGRYLMIYKGVAAGPMPQGGRVLHGLAWADSPLGPFRKEPEPILDVPGVPFAFEDPYLWHDCQGYHCLMKDMGQRRDAEGPSIVLAHSPDGRLWQAPSSRPVVTLTINTESGPETFERVERPNLFWDDATDTLRLMVAIKPKGEEPAFVARLEIDRLPAVKVWPYFMPLAALPIWIVLLYVGSRLNVIPFPVSVALLAAYFFGANVWASVPWFKRIRRWWA